MPSKTDRAEGLMHVTSIEAQSPRVDRRVPLPAVSSLPNKELISRTVMAFKECFFPVTCPEDRLAINLVTKVRDILG
ncbi:hypothetical protein TNCV_2840861 [Trichonephila clavipes]|uniref:Uncharacterized protein n=1 Tax=Trichonephila clavipes TaxID=2585209 RepID=A0A8X6RLD7_TRICX|nr:hypothetical protein TNCV_2840861 [Trichonephila clavipes]